MSDLPPLHENILRDIENLRIRLSWLRFPGALVTIGAYSADHLDVLEQNVRAHGAIEARHISPDMPAPMDDAEHRDPGDWFVTVCTLCYPAAQPGALIGEQPFRDPTSRLEWIVAHTRGTGHRRYLTASTIDVTAELHMRDPAIVDAEAAARADDPPG